MAEQFEKMTSLDALMIDSTERLARLIVGKWMAMGELGMIYAETGSLKTMICQTLAYCIATATNFLGYDIPKPRRVGFLDAEVGKPTISKRHQAIDNCFNNKMTTEHVLDYYSSSTGVLPNLGDPSTHNEYDALVEPYEVIILDNLMTIATPPDSYSNDFKVWMTVQDWLIRQKMKGKCVLLVHHTNKGRLEQSGTQQRENIQDFIIRLNKSLCPRDDKDKTYIDLVFKKHRHNRESEVENQFLAFSTSLNTKGAEVAHWEYMPLLKRKETRAIELLELGISEQRVADHLGLSLMSIMEAKKARTAEPVKWWGDEDDQF